MPSICVPEQMTLFMVELEKMKARLDYQATLVHFCNSNMDKHQWKREQDNPVLWLWVLSYALTCGDCLGGENNR